MNDQKHGVGKLQLPNGDIYQGNFEEDQFHGHGLYLYQQKEEMLYETEYEGEWARGQRSGLGQLKYNTGSILKGYFENNQLHGNGLLQIPSESKTIEGEWIHGELKRGVERVQIKGRERREEVYEGEFQGWQKHGLGTATYTDSSVYEGFFYKGRRNGHGVYMDALTQEKYEGKWVGDARNGRGRCSLPSGQSFEGKEEEGKTMQASFYLV